MRDVQLHSSHGDYFRDQKCFRMARHPRKKLTAPGPETSWENVRPKRRNMSPVCVGNVCQELFRKRFRKRFQKSVLETSWESFPETSRKKCLETFAGHFSGKVFRELFRQHLSETFPLEHLLTILPGWRGHVLTYKQNRRCHIHTQVQAAQMCVLLECIC